MKRVITLFLAALLLITTVSACTPAETFETLTPAQLLDLGERFLLEGNYEQAMIHFARLIEIEPMNPRGHVGLARAYFGMGNPARAREVLEQGPEDTEIRDMLDEMDEAEREEDEDDPANPPDPESGRVLRQGYYIWEPYDGGYMRYRFYLIDGIPQPVGSSEHGTIMAYLNASHTDGWEFTPHYWAGLRCVDCGELPGDGSMPDWFRYPWTHPWGGWRDEPRVFYYD